MKKKIIVITLLALIVLGSVCTYIYVEAQGQTQEIDGMFVDGGSSLINGEVHYLCEGI